MTNKNARPLCFTCKHGLCVRQTEKATILLSDSDDEDKDEWEDKDTIKPEPKQTEIRNEGYTVICFWNPVKNPEIEPVQFSEVLECNRYEKNSSKNNLTGSGPVVE